MGIEFYKFIGAKKEFSMEHRLLNIALIFGFIIALWSAVTNYFLGLDCFLVLTCVISAVVMAGLYYLSVVRQQYAMTTWLLIGAVFLIIPASWIFNGGISGSIPFYIILFSTVGATVFWGLRRLLLIAYFIVIASTLIFLEFNNPGLITGYSGIAERYIDIFVGLITTIMANTIIIVLILKHYNQEHEKAKCYLAESRQAQENLVYFSYHDALTGVYNRAYFEREVTCIEQKEEGIGIFVVDIDRLKFINDTLGHEQGDATLIHATRVLQASFGENSIIARIGGDEFAVIVRGVARNDMEVIYRRIRKNIRVENEKTAEVIIPLEMSVGYAYSLDANRPQRDLLREADNKMYREKLYRQSATEGSIIQTLKKMLLARDYDTGIHGERLHNMIANFARKAGIPGSAIADIQLFAEFHDVGKVGIPDHILHKPGPLTREEREQIQRHCEIGYRIAQTSTDLLPIADWILKHHEWWDGRGYPLGIKGEAIPLECRIVAIADAYDAMISDRPYRQAVGHAEAIEELKRYAGTQFDPALVHIFTTIKWNSH
ncbi:bifunctional diguanylate cyclase/phosphohydrolase [Sporomusa acidovorans]|uniref:Cyclic di-GMP phosphodiesterase response regulator RpfG n=1 Tax=Sporomusa acidovorans (strain ATCC 49682 / DSM 3132 / Mol) TaxID=1123286 RepID=A0ABZ3JB70_SPOA4|nr:diguanylate cyclase [Sporomusa acidovorans]OZC13327.1 cyclic di-GMP phosphodiesterase response regulator RpfG [Sporomusa acidovorans DSM 3132]SDD96465.1 diguanylate cyclase (GGDEF) domain-containing protein [Sporomusa acidovorans]